MRRNLILGLAFTLFAGTIVVEAQTAMQRRAARSQIPQTLRLLNRRLPEVRFDAVPFETVMQHIHDLTQINLVVRWEKLENAGIERDAPITFLARNLRLRQVLYMIMNSATDSDLTLAYRMSGDLLVLSTDEDLGREQITKVYDVADLMVRVPNTPQPFYENSNSSLGQGGSGGSIFGNSQNRQQQQNQYQPGQPTGEMQALIEVIQQTIEPDSWAVNGAGEGHVQSYGHLLIVTNTILVHQKIGGYITD